MQPQRVIVVEVNEVPLKVLRYYSRHRPGSTLGRVLREGTVLTSRVEDVPFDPNNRTLDQLYPSQSWASFNLGHPAAAHKIKWFNDPKPAGMRPYWERAADAGFSVGVVGSLHTSPAVRYMQNPNVRFLLPDCFAEDADAKPEALAAFQKFNLKYTARNTRAVSTRWTFGDEEIRFLTSMPKLGIRPETLAQVARIVGEIALRRVNRERLRTVQFLLMKDVFMHCMKKSDVDLGVVFTNHVAANLHRYWYATFPEDYEHELYSPEWVAKYRDEIPWSLQHLDAFIAEVAELCQQTDRVLILATSMGQHANKFLTRIHDHEVRVGDLDKLLAALGVTGYEVLGAMAPEYSLRVASEEIALAIADRLEKVQNEGAFTLYPEVNQNVLTISIWADPTKDGVDLGGTYRTYEEMGLRKEEVFDHHAASHQPEGSLVIYNSRAIKRNHDVVGNLEFAPAVCAHFGISHDGPAAPTFSF